MMKLLIVTTFFCLFLTSCFNKRISDPENSDFIYLDIQSDIKKANKIIKLRQTEIEIVKGEMEGLFIRSEKRSIKIKRITSMQKDLERFIQLEKYLQVKLKKRKVLAAMMYELAIKDNKSWPNEDEYNEYIIGKNHSHLPIKEINKADNSRELTHKKDISEILKTNGIKTK